MGETRAEGAGSIAVISRRLIVALMLLLAAPSAALAQTPTPPPTPVPPAFVGPAPVITPLTGVRGRIIRLAASQLGYHDHGPYCNKYGPCEEWCSLFATWAWGGAGVSIPSLPFTGSVYDWAAATTYVLPPTARPRPGDAVLFGTGPATVSSSRHIGIVEAVYPGYIVTIEGDSSHRVLRYVVPLSAPWKVGEPGRIYAFASPVPRAGATRAAGAPAPLSAARLRRALALQAARHRVSAEDRRLQRTIRRLRAFQHMPYHAGGVTIEWLSVNSQGKILVGVVSPGTITDAQAAWERFLARYGDSGAAYQVSYYTPS